jgi:hypothetical protein
LVTAIVPVGPAPVYSSPSGGQGEDSVQRFASIRDRPTWITGWPNSGWRGADASDPTARLMPFGFDITDDGAGHFLLVYYSTDRAYEADTWHETLSDACASAEERFGVRREEWTPNRRS